MQAANTNVKKYLNLHNKTTDFSFHSDIILEMSSRYAKTLHSMTIVLIELTSHVAQRSVWW